MKAGIDPELLVAQVKNTAGWLWEDPRARDVVGVFDGACADRGLSYFRLMLAAHFATVASFVPTDVDARIRHHVWAAMEDVDQVAEACDVVDEVARWDARWVSARTVDHDGAPISGHDGEWLGVRAGALGRAAVLGATPLVERLSAALDAELDREARAFEQALAAGPARRVLSLATILAHNLGDLSRVVEAWPGRPELASLRVRYTRLGHPDAPAQRSAFVTAGTLNKSLMALENHRFLALRKARALRGSRALLLPIGPWFDAWGEQIAGALDEAERVDVVTALLELHDSSPDQLGCLRALAGIHRKARGGLEVHVPFLPARLRKEAMRGRVREALDVTAEHFEARIDRKLRTERERLGGASTR